MEDKALIDKNEMMFNESDPQVNVFAIMYLYVRMTWRQIIGPVLCALILSNIITVPVLFMNKKLHLNGVRSTFPQSTFLQSTFLKKFIKRGKVDRQKGQYIAYVNFSQL